MCMWRERGGKKRGHCLHTLYLPPDIGILHQTLASYIRHWHPTSDIGILALRCTLQLPMLKPLQTREVPQSYSVHLYSVSLLETNEPCAPNAIGWWHCEASCVHWVTGTSEGGGSARRAVAVQILYTDFFTGSLSGGRQAAKRQVLSRC